MRWFRPPFQRLPVLLVLALSAAALFSGCDRLALLFGLTDPFKDYRDPKVNFIAASPLSNFDDTTANFETPGIWTWAWRGATDADDGAGGFPYMTLTTMGVVGGGAPPGLAATENVYRLELQNLMPGGDFEWAWGANYAANGWNYDPAFSTADTIAGQGLHGQSLSAHTDQLSNLSELGLRFNLQALAEAAAATQIHSYSLILFAVAPSDYSYQLAALGTFDSAADLQFVPIQVGAAQELTISPMNWNAGAGSELVFGSRSSPNDLTFDDFRVFRSDIVSDYRLRLLLRPRDTNPNLVHGQGYEFSVWVRKPPTLTFVDEATAVGPYAARSISLRLSQLLPSAEGSTASSSDAVYSVVSSPGWTRLVLRIANPEGTLDFPTTSSTAVIELAIIPFDYLNPEPGVVEIASPELHFYLENN